MDIKEFSFVQLLEKSELDFLSLNSSKVSLGKGAVLFYQDDICSDILLLSSGEVSLCVYSDDKIEPIELYSIEAGEQCIINTASAISQTKVIATAIALSDITGYLVSYSIIKKLMKKNEKYQDFIFGLFSIKFNSLTTLIEDIKYKKLDARILAYLLAKNTNTITTTHEQIAQHLNTSRVVISRVLKELENKNKLKLYRGKIKLL
ncbi:MAG: hypothetical protein DRG11_00625 [Epsilonproteobacteria bacterium]|nr:MAG: hypothetical protein DRG11_00625 [Campylobacterota bacterium]